MTDAAARFTLRQLPLPAKLVVTCFLLAVGGGYTAAMVQLHVQDSKSGKPMPDMHDVILKYTGKKWFTSEKDVPRPVSKFEKLITADEQLPFSAAGTMAPAFFSKDPAVTRASRAGEAERARIRAEREGERAALVLWANAPPEVRQRAYLDDHFGVDPKDMPKAITPEFKSAADAVRVKSLIEARCTRCHRPGGDDAQAANFPLVTYADIEKHLSVAAAAPFHAGGDWVRVQEPISLEKLTQSTHAHLLSFSVLFSLTGLVFAFSSYPGSVRCVLGPLVLVALVTDVSLWWLARQCSEWGPYFAMGIIGTGALAGLGLAGQIILSLFNMYGPKGKLVLAALFLLAGGIAGLVYVNQVGPALDAKQHPSIAPPADPPTKADQLRQGPERNGSNRDDTQTLGAGMETRLERMLRFPVKDAAGKDVPVLELSFKKDQVGGMVRAFFDKDAGEFAAAVKEKNAAEQARLTPERHGERLALLAWSKLPEPERRKAFAADALDMPAELAGKPFTRDYLKDGKVRIEALVTDRCVRCHADHTEEDKAPFHDYDTLVRYLK